MHRIDDPSLPSLISVACANFESVPRDKAATLQKILQATRDAARQGCDLVVFPELALNTWGGCEDCARVHRPCGWHLEQAELAHGPSSDKVAALARELGIHVIYGFEERDADDPSVNYNSAALVTPATASSEVRRFLASVRSWPKPDAARRRSLPRSTTHSSRPGTTGSPGATGVSANSFPSRVS